MAIILSCVGQGAIHHEHTIYAVVGQCGGTPDQWNRGIVRFGLGAGCGGERHEDGRSQ